MTNPIIIVGAGRQGRIAADILQSRSASVAGYLDDTKPKGEVVFGLPVLHGFSAMRDRAFVLDHSWFVTIGDNHIRCDLYRALADAGASFASVIHPSAQISGGTTLGRGLFIAGCTVTHTDSVIGDWVLIGANAFVGIDAHVGEAAYIGSGTIVAAGASVGARSFLGSGTILSNDVSVGTDCVVGAGSVVIRKLPDGTTAYGIPAQPGALKQHPFRS